MRPGYVETVAGETVLEPNIPVSLGLSAGPTSELELRCDAPQPAREWEETTCTLVFSTGSTEQVLEAYSACYQNGDFNGLGNGACATVVWAGDLNGDDQLDLVVDLSDHSNVELPALFLSPGPDNTRLLVRVAEHRSVGYSTDGVQQALEADALLHSGRLGLIRRRSARCVNGRGSQPRAV